MKQKMRVLASETGGIAGDGAGSRNMAWQNKGGRNATTNESKRGAGQIAPRPQNSKSQLMGASQHTASPMHSMARVKNAGGAPGAGNFLPVQKPPAGLQGSTIGQPDPHSFNPGGPGISIGAKSKMPVTGNSTATKKPRTRAALAFYGE